MENELKVKVLDHGYVVLRNMAGPTRREDLAFDAQDVDVAQAARMSFGVSGRTYEEDIRLNKYLIRNWHTSPFEQIVIWLEMKLPIMVARQWVRHRTARLNEISGRYVQLPSEWYIPRLQDVMIKVEDVKQGGRFVNMDDPVEVSKAEKYLFNLNHQCQQSYLAYEGAIRDGIAMEDARMFLHLNHYTRWLWQIDLHNFMSLLANRLHPHAQYPIRRYAAACDGLVRMHLPELMGLFDEYRRRY